MNARFWIFENDAPIRLTIKRGQSLKWDKSWHNGEGWSCRGVEWFFDGETLHRRETSDATDCDGRFSDELVSSCPAWALNNFLPRRPDTFMGEDIWFPEWGERSHSQRDYFAEAMGY